MEWIDGQLFKEMLLSGMNNLGNHCAQIDALNVFPVPDGDTGTNMYLTVSNGVQAALEDPSDSVGNIAKTLSRGLLMGARGNSGVITSQIFRGFYQAVKDLDRIDAAQLAHALVNGSRVAYRAVMRPVEGTILTVIREAADYTYAYTMTDEVTDCVKVMERMVKEAKESLDTTPQLLPVLAEVGVVDSGGKGLLVILEGFLSAMKGKVIEKEGGDQNAQQGAQTKVQGGEEEYGFCTEFILHLNENGMRHFSENSFKEELSTIGNSIVCVQDEDLVKVHVHTLEPQTAIKMGRRQGRFMKLKVENMQDQHDNILEKEEEEKHEAKRAPHKKYGIITVAAGDGIKDMFKELRADIVVGGGQTMNPSTEDFVSAINQLNCDHIFILPNNSNIILAAQQAQTVCEDVDVHVIPSKTIPQGLSACIMFNPDVDVTANLDEMNDALANVKSGEVTYAVRDTTYEGMEIKKGQYMGMFGKAIVACQDDCMEATKELLDKMLDKDSELVTLIYGEDATGEQAQELADYIEEHSDAEVEITNGQQPVYSFIIGVE
ncbi:DAK2 domain-containing protein [Dubosiella muris]|uniref:DAK2 domain-containing protein n=1 Tax=Dubosiella muris TaxID=3038133 RepID=A0AC61R5X9_9FIRM|nr:DAK2 domain-containing protein [Dubosiella muris]TGY65435.1 DAK2 domain-containing protein [Dubosiella muris]